MITLVQGGTVITPSGRKNADVLIRDGVIAGVTQWGEPRPRVDEVIDATRLFILPGIIDPHVHSRDPGLTYKEDFAHSTRAAAAGGVTAILEMPNSIPAVTDGDSFRARAEHLGPSAFVDFGLWGLAVEPGSERQFRQLRAAGAPAVKLFWGFAFSRSTGTLVYSPVAANGDVRPPASNGDVWQLLHEIASADLLLGIHCEDRSILQAAARLRGRSEDYATLLRVRPVEAECVAIASVIEMARATQTRLHILHVSSGRGVELVRAGRASGVDVTAETCPHYLTLTAADYPTIGPSMKVFPPVRTDADQAALWEAVADGTIISIGSDHAPHSLHERRQPFEDQPAGAIGVETMLRVLLDASTRGLVDLERLAWVLCEGTARRYGLFPQKGILEPGSDADMVLVDMNASWVIRNGDLHSKSPLSPWDGRSGRGSVVRTLLRGVTVAVNGQPIGSPRGRLLTVNA